MDNKFVHLHVHTKASLRDGLTEPADMMKKAKDHGMPAVAVTDHGTMGGIWEAAKYAKKYGVKLIPGNEFYIVPDMKACRGMEWGAGTSSHIILLAADQTGYNNILKLTALSNLEGFYYQPRIDYKVLKEYSEGVWCNTACLAGIPAKTFKKGNPIVYDIDMLHQIFGDRLSLEIQLNGIDIQEEYNDKLIAHARKSKIPLVAAVDTHYLNKQDSSRQDILFAMQMGKTLDDPNRYKMVPERFSFETPDEVCPRFIQKYKADGVAAIARTIEIADNCNVDITVESKDYKIPTLDLTAQPDWNEFQQWMSGEDLL